MATINLGNVIGPIGPEGPPGPAGSELAHNGTTKAIATNTGIDVTGDIDLADNGKIKLGNSADLQIYHDGSNSRIVDNGTGELRLQGTNLRLWSSSGENYITCVEGGAVKMYYGDGLRLATTSTGINVPGVLSATSFVGDGSGLTGLNVESEGMVMHSNTITNNLTIPTGKNAVTGGPIEIAGSAEVTISQGSTWTIV